MGDELIIVGNSALIKNPDPEFWTQRAQLLKEFRSKPKRKTDGRASRKSNLKTQVQTNLKRLRDVGAVTRADLYHEYLSLSPDLTDAEKYRAILGWTQHLAAKHLLRTFGLEDAVAAKVG